MWECDFIVAEGMVGIKDSMGGRIRKNSRLVIQYFHPLCFRSEDDAGTAEEEGFFLDAAAVCHDDLGILLENQDIKERCRRDEFDFI